MPRGKKRTPVKEKTFSLNKEDVLKQAKILGLFKSNKKYKTHEIILTQDEYEKI